MARLKTSPSRTAMRRWKIHLTVESKKLKVPPTWIRKTLSNVLTLVEQDIGVPEICELHVVLTDDARIRILNKDFRKKDKATDVLSFPQFSPQEISGGRKTKGFIPSPYLGDLVISTETTLRQAKKFGVTTKDELVRLLVHGILHLCGYDHEKVPAAEAQRMRRRERYLRALLSRKGPISL